MTMHKLHLCSLFCSTGMLERGHLLYNVSSVRLIGNSKSRCPSPETVCLDISIILQIAFLSNNHYNSKRHPLLTIEIF
jgi:hypothetical protein